MVGRGEKCTFRDKKTGRGKRNKVSASRSGRNRSTMTPLPQRSAAGSAIYHSQEESRMFVSSFFPHPFPHFCFCLGTFCSPFNFCSPYDIDTFCNSKYPSVAIISGAHSAWALRRYFQSLSSCLRLLLPTFTTFIPEQTNIALLTNFRRSTHLLL